MMLINSAGHVIFEVPFPEHQGKVPIEIFQAENGEIYIAFAAGQEVTIYKTYQKMGTIKIEEVFEPLELMYNDEDHMLRLVAKTESTSEETTSVAAFKIDFQKIESEMLLQAEVAPFSSTERRSRQIVLNRGPEQASPNMSLLKPEDLKERFFQSTVEKTALHNSINDDFFVV